MRTSTVILGLAVLAACEQDPGSPPIGIALETVGNPAPQQVGGQGSLIQSGELRTFAFGAVRRADGSTTGEFELVSRVSGAIIHGTIRCLAVVGTDAWLGGVIDRSNIGLEGETQFRVRDNGEGGPVPDRISLVSVGLPPGSAASYCAGTPRTPGLNGIVAGNIQIPRLSPEELAPATGLWTGIRFNPGGVTCCTQTWELTQTGSTVTGLLTAPHTGCVNLGPCPLSGTISGNTLTFRVDLTFAGDVFEQGTATITADQMTGTLEQCFFGSCTGGLTFDLVRQ